MATIPSNVWEAERTFYAEHFEVEDPGSIPTDQLENCDYKVLRQADDFMKKMVKENEELNEECDRRVPSDDYDEKCLENEKLKKEIEKLKQEVGQGKTFYQEVMRRQQAEMDKEHIRYLEKVQEVGELKAEMKDDSKWRKVFHCETCEKPIIQDTYDHDNCIINDDGIYCMNCGQECYCDSCRPDCED
jgi:hypothetical protein